MLLLLKYLEEINRFSTENVVHINVKALVHNHVNKANISTLGSYEKKVCVCLITGQVQTLSYVFKRRLFKAVQHSYISQHNFLLFT
jgi:hypothetical protein